MRLKALLAIAFIIPLLGLAACKNSARDNSSGTNLSRNTDRPGDASTSPSSPGSPPSSSPSGPAGGSAAGPGSSGSAGSSSAGDMGGSSAPGQRG